MCFSAEADLVAGIVIAGVGVDAVRHVSRREELPLASIPFVLAAHQLVESVVWRGLEGDASHTVGRAAIWAYLVIAFVVVPVLVPVALALLEPPGTRRRMYGFVALGAVVAAVLLRAMLQGPVVATIDAHHISYEVEVGRGGLVDALYVVATCGPMLTSSASRLRWYGVANLAAVVALAWFASSALISLWCLWAAVTSVAIALHLRTSDRPFNAARPVVPSGS